MVEITIGLMLAGVGAFILSHFIENYKIHDLLINIGVAGLVALMYYWTLLPSEFHLHSDCVWLGMLASVMYIAYALWRINELLGDFLYSGD